MNQPTRRAVTTGVDDAAVISSRGVIQCATDRGERGGVPSTWSQCRRRLRQPSGYRVDEFLHLRDNQARQVGLTI
jgi:hypothetical protein